MMPHCIKCEQDRCVCGRSPPLHMGPPNKAHWDQEAGKVAHFAYCQAMGLEDPVARWDRLPSEEQTAWCLAARAVLALVPSQGVKP